MKLVIETQFLENYGTPEEPRWKNKWGETYIVENYQYEDDDKFARDIGILAQFIESSGPMSEEYIIGYQIVEDDWVSRDESNQLEFEGKIMFYDTRLTLDGIKTKRFLCFDGHLYEHKWDAEGKFYKVIIE